MLKKDYFAVGMMSVFYCHGNPHTIGAASRFKDDEVAKIADDKCINVDDGSFWLPPSSCSSKMRPKLAQST